MKNFFPLINFKSFFNKIEAKHNTYSNMIHKINIYFKMYVTLVENHKLISSQIKKILFKGNKINISIY